MRIRKKKWVEPFLEEEHQAYIKQPSNYKGTWKEAFNKSRMHVEIGAGKGDYWLTMASMYPDCLWLAVEKEKTVGAVAIRKSYQVELDNVKMILEDAKHVDQWFAPGEIDVLHLNFSDPWPKKGHKNRRLSSDSFIPIYEKLLASDGEIRMKTDNEQLFEFSLLMFAQHKFTLVDVSVNFRNPLKKQTQQDQDAISEYEQRFIDLNQPIYRAVWRKHDTTQ
jgi:tRNA (guanine-N7-)-methyltransferase